MGSAAAAAESVSVERYWTRSEHGSIPVKIIDLEGQRWFEVERPSGSRVYDSARRMLMAFYGHDLHMTVERYFRIGRYSSEEPEGGSVLDLFGEDAPGAKITVHAPPAEDPEEEVIVLGIDLAARGHEVRKILMAKFGMQMHRVNLDPEEVLQEVYKGLLVRNDGKCPFDPRKSSFGHYVYMVCSCILRNYYRRTGRWREREVFGVRVLEGGESKITDVRSANLEDKKPTGEVARVGYSMDRLQEWILKEDPTEMGKLAAEVVPYLYAGHTRKAIAEDMGLKTSVVSRAVSHLRVLARKWDNLR